MIEVLFGESEAGSMKAAKNTVVYQAGKSDGPTSVWIAGKKRPPEREHCGWIEGTKNEVVCLGFYLDMGNIREPVDSTYRKAFLYSMFAQDQWDDNEEVKEELSQIGNVYCKELERLKQYLEEGESVRIWYSEAPYSMCGFYHLCTVLRGYQNQIHVVKLPKYRVRKDCITIYQNWGEVSAEEFAGFLPGEEILSQQEIRMFAMNWEELKEQNAPLRAVINGKLTGVPEDFYDFLIWDRLTEKPVKQARLIGDILGQSQLSVGDWWYARRIDQFIQEGKIKVVEDAKIKYARLICRAQEE